MRNLALRSRIQLLFLKIKTRMEILSQAKIPLGEEQMMGYAAFMANCRRSAREFGLLLESADDDLGTAHNEMFDNLSHIICEGELLLESL
jgi:hypothetical protein